jgi:hypothetical protein
MNQRDLWYARLVQRQDLSGVGGIPGQLVYCKQMIHRWEEFARVADIQFRRVKPDLTPIWKPLITMHLNQLNAVMT